MEKTVIRNVVTLRPKGADFCHNLAYKELGVEHLEEDKFLNFEYKGNRIASFDFEEQPCLSVETEPLTGTTTLSLRDNKPVVIIQGRTDVGTFALSRHLAHYSTVPLASGYTEGLKIRFQPSELSRQERKFLHRYTIMDEQRGVPLGIFILPACGSEMTLAFEDAATDNQRRIIIGVAAYIIADTFKAKYLANMGLCGIIWFLVIVFMIFLYFSGPSK